MHKRYYTATAAEMEHDLDTEQLLVDADDCSEDEAPDSPTHRRQQTARLKFCFILSFIAFFSLLYVPLFRSVNRHRSVALPGWWSNVSRDLRDFVEPDRNTTLIEPVGICDTRDKIFVLVVVCSAVGNFDARDTIRETWGNVSSFNVPAFRAMHAGLKGAYLEPNRRNFSEFVISGSDKINVKTLFLVGQTRQAYNPEFVDENQMKINEEAEIYGDILQEGFLDTYNNLTLKSVMLLKWVTRNCDQLVKYVLKTDDDTFINMPNLLQILLGGTIPVYNATIGFHDRDSILVKKAKNRLPDSRLLLLGHLFCGVKPVADTGSKWYTPYYLFPGDFYPAYLSGTAYLMSLAAAQKLYNTSLTTPYLHLEDVYLTGICASKVELKRTHHPLFFYSKQDKDRKYCSLRGMISQHQLSTSDMRAAFEAVTNGSLQCPGPTLSGKNSLLPKIKLQMKKKCPQK